MRRSRLALYLVALTMVALSGCKKPESWVEINESGLRLFKAGQYREAEVRLKEAVLMAEKSKDGGAELTESLEALGMLYYAQKDHGNAQAMISRALALREKNPASPKDSAAQERLASDLAVLADCNFQQGRLSVSEKLYKRAIEHLQKASMDECATMAISVSGLGLVYQETGKLEEAEREQRLALELADKDPAVDTRRRALMLANLGNLLMARKKTGEAEKAFKQAIEIVEAEKDKSETASDPVTAEALSRLAEIYSASGKESKAIDLLERAIAMRETLFGDTSAPAIDTVDQLARIYRDQGNWSRAQACYKRILSARTLTLGADHIDTSKTMSELARIYLKTGRLKEAEPLFVKALAVQENAQGAASPLLLSTTLGYAGLLTEEGRLDQADDCFQRALTMSERLWGREDPRILPALEGFTVLLVKRNLMDQARILEERAEAIKKAD